MLHIALYQPEIPPNTGNIIRLCANSGAQLHLIHPLGFELDDKRMRRAGLDYHEWANVIHYPDEQAFIIQNESRRIFACTTKTSQGYHKVTFQDEDMLLFGPETRGLPLALRERYHPIRIPMGPNSRSLNLSNAVAIILFEAWRQSGFKGAFPSNP
jgi:tRNA (cytidine/uridine-2'-O-)-methyltransferase